MGDLRTAIMLTPGPNFEKKPGLRFGPQNQRLLLP
jgi:hypothetical protein